MFSYLRPFSQEVIRSPRPQPECAPAPSAELPPPASKLYVLGENVMWHKMGIFTWRTTFTCNFLPYLQLFTRYMIFNKKLLITNTHDHDFQKLVIKPNGPRSAYGMRVNVWKICVSEWYLITHRFASHNITIQKFYRWSYHMRPYKSISWNRNSFLFEGDNGGYWDIRWEQEM